MFMIVGGANFFNLVVDCFVVEDACSIGQDHDYGGTDPPAPVWLQFCCVARRGCH